MGNPDNDILRPRAIVLPHVTTAVRNTMVAEVGTLIYNSTNDKIQFCKAATAAAASWEEITSVQEA